MLYINGSGTLDKVEIIKSSGFPLLDEAAIKEMKQSHFQPAMDGAIQNRRLTPSLVCTETAGGDYARRGLLLFCASTSRGDHAFSEGR